MFIYEFMGGVLEAVGRGEPDQEDEEGEYDPHHHRIVEKPTSYSETMMHMLKGSIGAGILAMPDGFRRMGLIAGTIGLVTIGSFATYCIHLLISAQYVLCKRAKKGYMSYPRSIKAAVISGPPCMRCLAKCLEKFVSTVLIAWQIGICCVYSVFVAENVKQVCDYYGYEFSIRIHILMGLVPLLILNMVKSLKLLSPLSSLSNLITLIGLILVFYYLMETDLDITSEMFEPKSWIDGPVFIGITLFALEAVGVVLALEYNMENPKDFQGCCGLFNVAMVLILCLYCAVGAFGYMKYGNAIKASLTLNLPQTDKEKTPALSLFWYKGCPWPSNVEMPRVSWALLHQKLQGAGFLTRKAQAAKLLIALAIALSHPLQNFVAYNQIWLSLSKKYDGVRKRMADYALRIVLVLIPVLLAIAVPELGPVISLVGAFCLSLLAIVFPAIIDICLWYPDEYGILRYKFLRDILIIILGVIALCSGVYTSILEIAQHAQESKELSIIQSEDM